MTGVNRGAATERASQVVEAFPKMVGRDDEMAILSKLLGLNSKREYYRDGDALFKGIFPTIHDCTDLIFTVNIAAISLIINRQSNQELFPNRQPVASRKG